MCTNHGTIVLCVMYTFLVTLASLVFPVGTWAKVLVPESIDDAHQSEATGDNNKALVLCRRSLWWNILVLASFEDGLVYAVQANGVWILLGDFIEL